MVNYRDRPGALRYGASIPFHRKNPKFRKFGLYVGAIYIMSGFFAHQVADIVRGITYSFPYWQNRRDEINLKRTNFDLLIESTSFPKDTINDKSIF